MFEILQFETKKIKVNVEKSKEATDELFDRNNIFEIISIFFKNLHSQSHNFAMRTNVAMRRHLENPQFNEMLNALNDKMSEHPILKFLALTAALVCFFPVFIFLLFGIISIAVTFTGFLLIEGTLLAVGLFCMFACMFFMMMIMPLMAVPLGMIYLLLLKVRINFDALKSSIIFRSLSPSLRQKIVTISYSVRNSHQN